MDVERVKGLKSSRELLLWLFEIGCLDLGADDVLCGNRANFFRDWLAKESGLMHLKLTINRYEDSFPWGGIVHHSLKIRSGIQYLIDRYHNELVSEEDKKEEDGSWASLLHQIDLVEFDRKMRDYWPPEDGFQLEQICTRVMEGEMKIPRSHWWWYDLCSCLCRHCYRP